MALLNSGRFRWGKPQRQALTRVGLERLAQAPFCRDAPEVLSVWGSNEPRSRHHIFSPYGAALHLDRRAFDEALAFAAREPGACFHGRLPYDRNRQRHFCLIARSPQGGVPVRQLFERFCVPTVTFPRMKKPSGTPPLSSLGISSEIVIASWTTAKPR